MADEDAAWIRGLADDDEDEMNEREDEQPNNRNEVNQMAVDEDMELILAGMGRDEIELNRVLLLEIERRQRQLRGEPEEAEQPVQPVQPERDAAADALRLNRAMERHRAVVEYQRAMAMIRGEGGDEGDRAGWDEDVHDELERRALARFAEQRRRGEAAVLVVPERGGEQGGGRPARFGLDFAEWREAVGRRVLMGEGIGRGFGRIVIEGDGFGRGEGAVTEEMIKEAQALREKDASIPCPAKFSRACLICSTENPYQRAVFTLCGHIVCYSCAVDNARSDATNGKCAFCRKKSSFVKLFEEESGSEMKKEDDVKVEEESKADDSGDNW